MSRLISVIETNVLHHSDNSIVIKSWPDTKEGQAAADAYFQKRVAKLTEGYDKYWLAEFGEMIENRDWTSGTQSLRMLNLVSHNENGCETLTIA